LPIPALGSELHTRRRENLKSHTAEELHKRDVNDTNVNQSCVVHTIWLRETFGTEQKPRQRHRMEDQDVNGKKWDIKWLLEKQNEAMQVE
jgi:hypothetical protein